MHPAAFSPSRGCGFAGYADSVIGRRALLGVAALATLLTGCGQATASVPSPSPPASVVAPSPSPRPTPSPSPPQRLEAPLPRPVEETAAAVADGKLYVMGGFDAAGNSLDSVFVFDGMSWQSGPALPLRLDHPSAATLDGQIYIAGGHSNGSDSAKLFRLDGDHWSPLTSMKFPRGGHALVAAQGHLYAIGGNTNRGNVDTVESYDPAANMWTPVVSMPTPRNHLSGFLFGTSICVAGGRSPTTDRVDCLDPVHDTWSSLPKLPRPTSGGGATAFFGGGAVMLGGQNARETAIVDQLTHYSPAAGWTTGETMLVPRHGFQLAVFEGRAWACGGATAPGLNPVDTCTSIANPAPVQRAR